MSYLGYIEGLARVGFGWSDKVPDSTCSHLYRGTFGEVGAPLCPKGWRKGVHGEISIFRENTGGGGLCLRCMRMAEKLGPNAGIPYEGLTFDDDGKRRGVSAERSEGATQKRSQGVQVSDVRGGL